MTGRVARRPGDRQGSQVVCTLLYPALLYLPWYTALVHPPTPALVHPDADTVPDDGAVYQVRVVPGAVLGS